MTWMIVAFALAALAAYLVFFRKPAPRELVIRVESSVSNGSAEETNSEAEEKDNWEKFDFYRAKMLPAKGRYRINYEDQRGFKTERDIEVKRVHECDGKYAVDAHCLLRNAHRSFLSERVAKAVNLDTGEIVENLAGDAIAQYADTGEARALSAINKEWMGVAVLVFVCRADGQMRQPERAVVAEYLKRHCADMSLDDGDLDSAIKALGEPDLKEFKRIIRDLKDAGDQERLTDLLGCAKRIVETQKSVAPMEKAALEMLQDAVVRSTG